MTKRIHTQHIATDEVEDLFVRHERYRRVMRLLRDGHHIRDIARSEKVPEQVIRNMLVTA